MTWFFELWANDAIRFRNGGGEADERRWHVHILERAAHGILAADGRELEVALCGERAEQRFEWLAPALWHVFDAVEIFLHGQINVARRGAGGNELHDGFEHAMISAPELVLAHGVWRKSVSKKAGGVGFTAEHRNLGDHGLDRRGLILAAEWEEHGAGADGGIELFNKTCFGANVESGQMRFECVELVGWHGNLRMWIGVFRGDDAGFLACTGRIDKGAREINDVLAAVFDDHPARIRHVGDVGAFEVFFVSHVAEGFPVFLGDDAGHTLLAFRDRQLGACEAFVFLRHAVEMNVKAVGKLANGDGNTASTEVVAALDHAGDLRSAEEALDLALFDRIPLLHFCAGGFEGVGVLLL